MAEAYFNQMASHLGLRAASAGTQGAGELNQTAVAVMAEDGIDMSIQVPKVLTQSMADDSKRIVSMGCGVDAEACPAKFLVTEDWGLDDPAGQPRDVVRRVRDEVKARVQQLISEMAE